MNLYDCTRKEYHIGTLLASVGSQYDTENGELIEQIISAWTSDKTGRSVQAALVHIDVALIKPSVLHRHQPDVFERTIYSS